MNVAVLVWLDSTHHVKLQPVKEEKDLGVTITDDLRPRTQCLLSAAKVRTRTHQQMR